MARTRAPPRHAAFTRLHFAFYSRGEKLLNKAARRRQMVIKCLPVPLSVTESLPGHA